MTLFDWNDYLRLAQSLASEPGPASRRTAISRANYACYGVAVGYAPAHGFPHRVVTHDRIWEWFHRLDDPAGQQINELGKRIKNRRIAADYRAEDEGLTAQARLVCSWASELVELLSTLPDQPGHLPEISTP